MPSASSHPVQRDVARTPPNPRRFVPTLTEVVQVAPASHLLAQGVDIELDIDIEAQGTAPNAHATENTESAPPMSSAPVAGGGQEPPAPRALNADTDVVVQRAVSAALHGLEASISRAVTDALMAQQPVLVQAVKDELMSQLQSRVLDALETESAQRLHQGGELSLIHI